MIYIMSDLEEITDSELLEQSDGEISLSDKSDFDEDVDDEDISSSEDIIDDDEGSFEKSSSEQSNDDDDDDDVDDNDPWILDDVDKMENKSSELIQLSEDENEEEDSDYDEEELKKLEKTNNKDILIDYHPEMKHLNYKELTSLTKITRNKNGLIIDPLHKTLPIMTRYEKTKILGLRAKQINDGSPLFIKISNDIIDGHVIAKMELDQNKIPFIIRRPLPNGQSEYWNVKDLEVIN